MKNAALLLALALLLSASRCNEKNTDLTGTRWRVVELRQPNANSAQLPVKDYVLEFRDDKSLGIRLDINNCFGGYAINPPDKIIIQPLACTKACCDSDLAMQVTALLPQMTTFLVKKKNVLLLEGEGSMRLERVE